MWPLLALGHVTGAKTRQSSCREAKLNLSCVHMSVSNGFQGNWDHLGSIWLKQRRDNKAEGVQRQRYRSRGAACRRDGQCEAPLSSGSLLGKTDQTRCVARGGDRNMWDNWPRASLSGLIRDRHKMGFLNYESRTKSERMITA